MVHGSAGTFDLNLPLTGTPAIECRSNGANGNYTVVMSFTANVTSCGTTPAAGGSVVAGPNSNQCTVNLTGVVSGHTISVELDNVTDTLGDSGNVSVPMSVLVADTSGDGFVDAIDTSQTKSQSGQAITQSNFREDVNVDGFIDAIDVSLVKSKSGSVLSSASPSSATLSPKSGSSKTARNSNTRR